MIDIKDYVKTLKDKYKISNPNFEFALSEFFVNNDWFGYSPAVKDGKVYISEKFINGIKRRMEEFCKNYDLPIDKKKEFLLSKLKDTFPDTCEKLIEFSKSNDLIAAKYKENVVDNPETKRKMLSDECMYYLLDYMLFNLSGELAEASNKELKTFIEESTVLITCSIQNVLVGFVIWLHYHYKTVYNELYLVKTETRNNTSSEAYDSNEYLTIIYHLFNEEYIDKKQMYKKAADSKNYIDTWLFLSIYFVAALRSTDVVRIPHPTLPCEPKLVLEKVKNNEFTDAESWLVLNTVIWELQLLSLTPNKTKRIKSKKDEIHVEIPYSVRTHLGKLFAIAEAHYQLSDDENDNLIRCIKEYKKIKNYMGDEIGDLFRSSDFRVRSANKSYLQAVQMLTSSVLDLDDNFNINGYMLASYARSHKAKYGSFAAVTSKYLKDAKMGGFTDKFIAKELAERGVLSSITSTLLNLISDGEYGKLTVKHQTEMIKTLDLTPRESENIVSVYESNKKHSVEIARNIYKNTSKENVTKILHNIANGSAASKKMQSLCLLSSMGKMCPNSNNCTGCQYEIGTTSTLIAMKNELSRLKKEYKTSTNEVEKMKCKHLAINVVAPSIQELLTCYEEQYGKDELKNLELILREEK